jgi:methylenetetrahydrofolate reductase (NADPH)
LRIRDLYAKPGVTISFEFFPPKSPEAETTLFEETIPALVRLKPSFFSVTYGAGGSTREATLRIVSKIRRSHPVEAMAHLTCVGSTKDDLARVLDEAQELGIENILALRGDPPKGETAFKPVEGGFAYSTDLIRYVKSRGFGVGGACYPEGHLEAPNKVADWDIAAAKVEAGADFLITQLFYDWQDFLEMEDYLRNKKGITVPLIPGVLPFQSTKQIKRFTSLCGARLSPELLTHLEKYENDDVAVQKLGVEVCTNICRQAVNHGAAGIHFYCLNRTPSCQAILVNLGLA